MGAGDEVSEPAVVRKQVADGLTYNLRHMRHSKGFSQLELGFRMGVSQRHVSFVELGRARPSRALILRWAHETGASNDECNAALVSAGFSAAADDPGISHLNTSAFRALSGMLDAHEPLPGLVFNADWKVCAMNESGRWLGAQMMPDFLETLDGPPKELDMIAALTHHGGLLSHASNGRAVGFALLRQLRAEQLIRPSLKLRIDRYHESLNARFGDAGSEDSRPPGDPHLQLLIDSRFGPLSFLLIQTVFALPQNVTLSSLRSELWFPMDAHTRNVMTKTMRSRATGLKSSSNTACRSEQSN